MLGLPPLAQSQTARPNLPKNIKIVVPYSPGGGTDIIARHLAERLRNLTGSMVLVDNKPGANGAIGTDIVAKSPPDGSAIVLVVDTHLLNPVLMPKLPYDTFKDLKGVTQVAVSPMVVVTSTQFAGPTAREFVAQVRSTKMNVSYGSSENMTRLIGNMFVKAYQIEAVHIPYKGGGPLMTDVASGVVTVGVTSVLTAKQLIDAGRIRAIAITGPARSRILPDTPTLKELGHEVFERMGTSYSLYAPSATPLPILNALQGAVAEVIHAPDMSQILANQAATPVGNSVADFNRLIPPQFEFMRKMALEAGLDKEGS